MKKIIISIIFTLLTAQAATLKCTPQECDITETISFLGYDLYEMKYTVNKGGESIILTYNISVSKEKNNDKIREKYSQNNKKEEEYEKLLEEWIEKTIETEDGTTYEVAARDNISELKINNKSQVRYEDKSVFGKKYLNIWIGKNPVSDDLKEKVEEARSKFK